VRTVRTTFEKVTWRATRRRTENGKKKQQTRTFMQTLNPWNKDADGNPKSREQIWKELQAEADKWMAEQS